MGAIVYLDGGKSESEEGGGVCQVSSTIYECVLLANLQVTERAPHMFEVTYVPRGQDATVYWGQLDFKFKNNTGYPIRIDASVSGGYVHIALVGTKEDKDYDHVTLTYQQLATKPWKTVGVTSENAPKSDEIELTITGETGVDKNGKTVKLGNLLKYYHPCAFFQRRRRLFIQHIPANVSLGGLHLAVHIKTMEFHAVLLFLQGKQSDIIHQISCIHHFHAHFLPPNSSLNAAAPSSPVST